MNHLRLSVRKNYGEGKCLRPRRKVEKPRNLSSVM